MARVRHGCNRSWARQSSGLTVPKSRSATTPVQIRVKGIKAVLQTFRVKHGLEGKASMAEPKVQCVPRQSLETSGA